MRNTVYNLKRILGRKYRDPSVQKELQLLPFTVLETANGNIGVKVSTVNTYLVRIFMCCTGCTRNMYTTFYHRFVTRK